MAVVGILFTSLLSLPENAYATCVTTIQAQAIAAAYEGDAVPTVHTMDTCSGDDVSYSIPIATTITFDGVQYDRIYATTNSVITFGQPDGNFWDYPTTPSISLYSMDWFPGRGVSTNGLDILYSNGGFQINLQAVPYWQQNAPQASNINIVVAITNSGGISVAYSYQGPEYANMRTGVRLHDGRVVTLQEWGATQIQPGSTSPTLPAAPISGSVTGPTTAPLTPEQQQAQTVEAINTANDIAAINDLIIQAAESNGLEVNEPTPEPTIDPTPEPTTDPDVVVVEPEIVTPEDPRFPDGTDEQTQPDETTPTPDSDITPEPEPSAEPSVEPTSQPEDTNQDPVVEPTVDPSPNQDISTYINTTTMGISQEDANKLIKLAANNASIAQAVQEFSTRAEENKDAPMPYTIADAVTEVQAEKLLSDPIGTLTSTFTNIDLKVLSSPSEWGKDMTDDQREKVQEIVIPVIIASNIVAASMTRRNK
jgi:hypothetical protein